MGGAGLAGRPLLSKMDSQLGVGKEISYDGPDSSQHGNKVWRKLPHSFVFNRMG